MQSAIIKDSTGVEIENKQNDSKIMGNSGKESIGVLSRCTQNNVREVNKDTESNNIYAKCIVCGNLPENIFIDADGNQVSYESKILNDIKDMVYRVEQRISNLEREVESLGSGQVLIEQSMAYINQFLSENK